MKHTLLYALVVPFGLGGNLQAQQPSTNPIPAKVVPIKNQRNQKDEASIVGSWISPNKDSEWNFQKDGAFTYKRSGEPFAGRWTRNGARISVDAKNADGTATLVRWFDIKSISETELNLLMNGERPYTWKRLSQPSPSEPPPAAPRPLEWINKDGKVIQAEFIQLAGEAVVIRKDGQQFTIPFANLVPASVEQAKKLGAKPQ